MAERVMRQLAILFWDARNLFKCDVNIVGKSSWCRQFTGTYLVYGMLGYDRDDKYMYYMSHNQCTCMNPLTTTMSHNHCMNPLTTSCRGTSKYKLTTRLNTTSLCWNRTEVPDYWCCLSILHLKEWQRERESWELTKTWSRSWKGSGNWAEYLCNCVVPVIIILVSWGNVMVLCIAFVLLCSKS